MKFRYLKVDLESQTTYTCHAAQPHKIDFAWLSRNPGQLFNHEINLHERQMMLDNHRAASCEQNCWHAEDLGQISPRLYQQGQTRTHEQIECQPEILDLTVGPQCNLTCSYCCKEFSSAWRQDLADNGAYDLGSKDDRYRLTIQDQILMRINQPTLMSSPRYLSLLEEISLASSAVKKLDVTGGEPFLNNQLIDILNRLDLPADAVINIYTGLGVDAARLARMLDALQPKCKVQISVSAECTGRHFEFNRYGLKWSKFQKNLQCIMDKKFPVRFHSTLTNLTAFGFVDFVQHYRDHEIVLTFAHQPRMQALHVMDPASKEMLLSNMQCLPDTMRDSIETTISPTPTSLDRENIKKFIKQFSNRRPDLDLAIYPRSFLSWLEQ